MPPLRFTAVVCLVVVSAGSAVAQVQDLKGSYEGVVGGEFSGLSITDQTNRRFSGLLPYIEQDNLVAIAGTIAASGNCQIKSDPGEPKVSLKLDWISEGGGAATLTGSLTDATVKGSSSVAFLRPFSVGGIDWTGEAGASYDGMLVSRNGVMTPIELGIVDGTSSTFRGGLAIGAEIEITLVGTSSASDQFVAIGVGDGLFVRLEGTVTIGRDGRGVFDGTYVIETITGKLFDTGIIAILIG